MEFRSDGTFTSPILQGNWDLSGNRLTIRGTGFEYHTTFRKIDERTLESTDNSGKSGQTRRCSWLPDASGADVAQSDDDAKFAAEQLEYEQKLAVQQKAVAEFEAAQRQLAADKAAAAAKASAAQEEFARQQAAYQAEQDRYARERAEYEAKLAGRPLEAGAATLTPLSTGGPQAKAIQEGEDARIIASDGKSAMDCVNLVELTKTDSSTGGGGRVLANNCSDEVEIGWCYTPGDCETETGSSWTVQPGRSWPVSAEKQIRWVACHGKNTAGFVKGSYGLRYYCKAPAS